MQKQCASQEQGAPQGATDWGIPQPSSASARIWDAYVVPGRQEGAQVTPSQQPAATTRAV
jgi:hypothetical protein